MESANCISDIKHTLGLAAAAKTSASDEKVTISGEKMHCCVWSGDVHSVECNYNNNNSGTRAGSFIANSV